jgi:hypothetical protein
LEKIEYVVSEWKNGIRYDTEPLAAHLSGYCWSSLEEARYNQKRLTSNHSGEDLELALINIHKDEAGNLSVVSKQAA